MKKLMLLALLLVIPSIVFGQAFKYGSYGWRANSGELVKTFTTYLSTSDDTTGWISISDPVISSYPLLADELQVIAVASDSVHADIYFIGRNDIWTTVTTSANASCTYTDSLHGWANLAYTATLPYFKTFTLKGQGVYAQAMVALAGCTQFKIGTVFKGAGEQGNTARTLKYYVKWKVR